MQASFCSCNTNKEGFVINYRFLNFGRFTDDNNDTCLKYITPKFEHHITPFEDTGLECGNTASHEYNFHTLKFK